MTYDGVLGDEASDALAGYGDAASPARDAYLAALLRGHAHLDEAHGEAHEAVHLAHLSTVAVGVGGGGGGSSSSSSGSSSCM